MKNTLILDIFFLTLILACPVAQAAEQKHQNSRPYSPYTYSVSPSIAINKPKNSPEKNFLLNYNQEDFYQDSSDEQAPANMRMWSLSDLEDSFEEEALDHNTIGLLKDLIEDHPVIAHTISVNRAINNVTFDDLYAKCSHATLFLLHKKKRYPATFAALIQGSPKGLAGSLHHATIHCNCCLLNTNDPYRQRSEGTNRSHSRDICKKSLIFHTR